MRFSIIIPALNEASFIETAITALKKQSVPRSEFEIIVVDNDSEDNTVELARLAGADKVIRELRRGTNIARQTGFEESRGEIVAFLDADCRPPSDWLREIEENLSKKNVAAISGPYDYEFKGWKKYASILYLHYFFRYLDKLLFFIFGREAGVIMGGNFAATRNTIETLGGLPPLTFYGDDAKIAILISRKVGPVVFNPTLSIVSSDRRFKKQGLVRLTLRYAWNYARIYFQ